MNTGEDDSVFDQILNCEVKQFEVHNAIVIQTHFSVFRRVSIKGLCHLLASILQLINELESNRFSNSYFSNHPTIEDGFVFEESIFNSFYDDFKSNVGWTRFIVPINTGRIFILDIDTFSHIEAWVGLS